MKAKLVKIAAHRDTLQECLVISMLNRYERCHVQHTTPWGKKMISSLSENREVCFISSYAFHHTHRMFTVLNRCFLLKSWLHSQVTVLRLKCYIASHLFNILSFFSPSTEFQTFVKIGRDHVTCLGLAWLDWVWATVCFSTYLRGKKRDRESQEGRKTVRRRVCRPSPGKTAVPQMGKWNNSSSKLCHLVIFFLLCSSSRSFPESLLYGPKTYKCMFDGAGICSDFYLRDIVYSII